MYVKDGNEYYLCIDLKSFYASVECVERGLDPMTTNLVVADPERGGGTICLAISPSMKKLGVKNRCRVYEIPGNIEYITAPPRMQLYIDYMARIYSVYLDYISPDDIHVYSIDEAFLYISPYLRKYDMSPREMAQFLMDRVSMEEGVRVTCGIGTNLYLTKIALDIISKHAPDFIGYLDEKLYIEKLWNHRPLTDFWRIGPGIQARLARIGIHDMEGIARADEDLLYEIFGIDAELLIDHAYGRETARMEDIKKYEPKSNSISSGQVLLRDYSTSEARLIVKEMTDLVCLDMVERHKNTSSISLYIGYSHTVSALPSGGTVSFLKRTNADMIIIPEIVRLYDSIVKEGLPVRRIGINCNNILDADAPYQMDIFSLGLCRKEDKNNRIQKAVIDIKKRFGKDAILKGMNYEEAGMTIKRNHQIGGHKSGL